MRALVEWIFNPIITKEFRSRMRGWRAFATLTGALVFLGGFSYAIYRMAAATARYSSTPLSPLIGQTIFAGLAFLELLVICAITPAVTAGAISGEKEKQTYEMLLATPLRPTSILWGKLISALGYIFLLIFAAIPMSSLVFIFGGVSLRDMLKAIVMLAATAIMFGVIGLFISTLLGRSGRATAVTYVIVFLMLFGPFFVGVVISTIRQADPPRWVLIASPFSALGSAIAPSVNPTNLSSIFWMMGGTYWFMGAPTISIDSIPRPLYHYSLPVFGAITLILYLLSTRLVLPTRRWRIQWTEALLALVLLLGFIGLTAVGYLTTANRYEGYLQSPSMPGSPPVEHVQPKSFLFPATPAIPGIPSPARKLTSAMEQLWMS